MVLWCPTALANARGRLQWMPRGSQSITIPLETIRGNWKSFWKFHFFHVKHDFSAIFRYSKLSGIGGGSCYGAAPGVQGHPIITWRSRVSTQTRRGITDMLETSLVMPEDPHAIWEPSGTIRVALGEPGAPPRRYKKRGFIIQRLISWWKGMRKNMGIRRMKNS